MKVFKLRSDVERYRWLASVKESDERILSDLHDGATGAAWHPVRVHWLEDELNVGLPKGDYPTLSTIPVFSKRAVDALLDLLIENGELLPLDLPGEHYFAFNPTRYVDALDEERSEIVRFPTGRVLDVTRYAFQIELLRSVPIFRLPQVRGRVFVTDQFATRVRDADLTGFDLQEVWSSPR